MNQAQFMRDFNNANREHFNDQLFVRSNEENVEAIHKVARKLKEN
jgi:hypothetical protein